MWRSFNDLMDELERTDTVLVLEEGQECPICRILGRHSDAGAPLAGPQPRAPRGAAFGLQPPSGQPGE